MPKTITLNQVELRVNVLSTDLPSNTTKILYQLVSDKGKIIETGNKIIPTDALASLTGSKLDIDAANKILSGFGIAADTNQDLPALKMPFGKRVIAKKPAAVTGGVSGV